MCWNVSGELRPFHLASRAHSRELYTWSSTFQLGDVPRAVGVDDAGTIELPTASGRDILAAYAESHGQDLRRLGPLDFLVLDVHGAEYECLQGFGADGLRGFNYIFVELSGLEMFVGQHRACDVHGFLTDCGFDCEVNCGSCEDVAHYDAFYVRREVRRGASQVETQSLSQLMLSLS
mmetsp:Transcript_10369/g.20856  ORF Transcript_10369/g.20856 Transcript_10369/m.20856 type:complete len:177 (-) Transcript_10369:1-531(-)